MTDISKEAVEAIAAERTEKAGESYMMAQIHIDAGYDKAAQAWVAAGEHAQLTADTLRAQAARIAELEAALATAREDALREAYIRAHNAFQRTENFYMVLGAINPKDTQ